MSYDHDKDPWEQAEAVVEDVEGWAQELHPTDRVTYYREVAKKVTELGDAQASENEARGVPER